MILEGCHVILIVQYVHIVRLITWHLHNIHLYIMRFMYYNMNKWIKHFFKSEPKQNNISAIISFLVSRFSSFCEY